jgi:hypothetical protein
MKLVFFAALAAATPVCGAERTLSVTDFERLRVEGGFTVEVRAGSATTAKVIGTQQALDITSVEVQGRQLNIRRNRSGWGGYPGQVAHAAVIRLTVPLLSNVLVIGPAKVSVDRLRGQRVAASLEGAGTLYIAGTLAAIARGGGTFDGTNLVAADAKLTSESAGDVTIAVKRAVTVTMTGSGTVTVLGKPACTVRNTGSGTVNCGSDQSKR